MLIIGSVWPEPQSSAAGTRMMQLIAQFLNLGLEITFASAAAQSHYSFNLSSLKINQENISINDSGFDEFIRRLNPTIVIFDRFMVEEQFGWRVAENCPDALRIVDTEDLHCLRRGRQLASAEGRVFYEDDLLNSDVAKREVASILRSDLSLIISGYELDLLTRVFKVDRKLLHYMPFFTEKLDEQTINSWPSFSSRKHFISIGNFLHAPNLDAVLYLKSEIWPIIRKELPQAEMHVYGAYPSSKIMALNNPDEGFLLLGRAEIATEVMQNARLCLAPLRFGAGLKGKLLEAMCCGTPSVTTSIGAESMNDGLAWNGAVADEPGQFAEAAISFYKNEDDWKLAQLKGAEIVNTRFLTAQHTAGLLLKIDELQAGIKAHRLQNFTGAMLMHHTVSSTKYLSRWIEEKNKV